MSRLTRGALLVWGGALAVLPVLPAAAGRTAPRFALDGARFLLDGKPLQNRAGEMHYPRGHRAVCATASARCRHWT